MVKEVGKLVEIAKSAGVKELSLKLDKTKILIRFSESYSEQISNTTEEPDVGEISSEEVSQGNIVEVKSNFVGVLKLTDKKGNPIVSEKKSVKKDELLGYAVVLGIEHEILSPVDGVIDKIFLKDGDVLEYGVVIMTISTSK